ncbi:MAG: hypothetical protein EDM79_12005 [Chloroflexi bacterium]|nr:MAG: hypothetical protein EDM79_12005 [Chloroflexota bacterium]
MSQKALIDFTDKDLRDALKKKAENVVYSYSDYREEMFRRSQIRIANALNVLTFVVTIATVINVIVSLR